MSRNTLPKYVVRYRFPLLLALNALFAAAVTCWLPCRYETNDDVVMAWISSGAYTGVPDGHLVFINVLYGRLVAALYTLMPGVEWYTLALVSLHVVSLTALGMILSRPGLPRIRRVAALALLYMLETRMLLLLQFTTTAAMVAVSALAVIAFGEGRKRALGMLWFLVAALIRFKAAMLVGVVFALFYPALCKIRGFDFRVFALLGLSVAGSLALYAYDAAVYRADPAWRAYREYNRNRGQINDNPNARRLYGHLPEGVSATDYVLLRYFFADTNVLTTGKLQAVNHHLSRRGWFSKMRNVQLMQTVWELYGGVITLALVFTLLCGLSRGRTGWWFLLPALGVFLLLMGMSLNSLVKGRIVITVYLTYMVVLTLLSGPGRSGLPAFALWISVLLWSSILLGQMNRNEERRAEVAGQRALMERLPAGTTLCGFSAAIHSEYADPWRVSSYFPVRVKGKGWLAASPFNDDVASYTDFVDSDKAIFCYSYDYPVVFTLVARSLEANYGLCVISRPYVKTDQYVMFNFHKIPVPEK